MSEQPSPNIMFIKLVETLSLAGKSKEDPDSVRAYTAYAAFTEAGDASQLTNLYKELVLDVAEVEEDPVKKRLEEKFQTVLPGFTLEKLESSGDMKFELGEFLISGFNIKLLLAGEDALEYTDFEEFRAEVIYLIENDLIVLPDGFHEIKGKCKNEDGEICAIHCEYEANINRLLIELL